ncbi:MAG: UvrD-helicase domain-containing protein [Bacteroides sp.]|nr:UvrD-helicase domain-containing protein [Prevotella sp.]MCM1408082.1 UvrD-helicase domain-containing protein [Treponema brennaborense]MCM1469058.1 UvrD-helicase domain-containing protein [Bacteroides sp.]
MADINADIDPVLIEGLNPEQLAAVVKTDNTVVAAGAGSGKTFVLARRFVFLVASCNIPVENILTLTFTEKAAAEMYQRIYKMLKEFSVNPSARQTTRTRAASAIRDFFHARIQTIDSYCASIVRMSARFYGIRPDFSVNPDAVTEFARQNALPFLLEHRKNPAVAELIQKKSPEEFAQEIFVSSLLKNSVISAPADYAGLLEEQRRKIDSEWKKDSAEAMRAIQVILREAASMGKDSALAKSVKKAEEEAEKIAAADVFQADNVSPEQAEACARCVYVFSKISLKGGSAKDAAAVLIKDEVQNLRKIYDKFSAAAAFIIQYPLMKQFVPLLTEFETQINRKKRADGILTFADIAAAAVDTLIKFPDIRQAEKQQFQAIMIDEFQDDNEMQRKLLFLLAERPEHCVCGIPKKNDLCPDKLFFVGDEKQSIYKFRGADVSVFNHLKNELSPGTDISLSVNYRSHPALIAAFNTIFGGFSYEPADETDSGTAAQPSVFLRRTQLTDSTRFPDYEAEYRKVSANFYDQNSKEKLTYTMDPRVHICLFDKTNADSAADFDDPIPAKETEAIFAAKKIKSLIDSGVPPEDIAVLFRSYTNQYWYEKYFRAENIPYASENIVGFFGDAPVNDIYFLLRLVIYPQDSSAYAAVLRSPFCRISHDGLMLCLDDYMNAAVKLPFSETCLPLLLPEDAAALIHVCALYKKLCELAEKLPVTELLSVIWYEFGYRFETLWNSSVSLFSELYDFLFEIARQTDAAGGSLSAFVDKLDDFRRSGERIKEVDVPLERSGAVRIMSIHKSKGLEFPVVFLCCAGDGKSQHGNKDSLFIDDKYGATLNFPIPPSVPECKKNWFFEHACAEEQKKQEAEMRRLLYVAATRAEKELYIIANYTLPKEVLQNLQEEHILRQDNSFFVPDEKTLFCAMDALWKHRRNQAEKKAEKTDALFYSDGTLFSHLLPVIAFYADAAKAASDSHCLPFTLEAVPPCTRREMTSAPKTGRITTETVKSVYPLYNAAQEICTDIITDNHISPSNLHAEPNFQIEAVSACTADASSSFAAVDAVIAAVPNGAFGYADFGTAAHHCVEALLSGKTPSLLPQFSAVLTDAQRETVSKAALEMAENFICSDLGKLAQNSALCKTEYGFKMILEKEIVLPDSVLAAGSIVSGKIDLLFENSDDIYIVDFKTDAAEYPEKHILQLALYCRAASLIYRKNVRAWIYYLRTGNSAELTAEIRKSIFFRN